MIISLDLTLPVVAASELFLLVIPLVVSIVLIIFELMSSPELVRYFVEFANISVSFVF